MRQKKGTIVARISSAATAVIPVDVHYGPIRTRRHTAFTNPIHITQKNPYNPCVTPNAATFFTYWNALATQFNFWWQKTVSTMYMCQSPFENELKDYLLSAPSCRSHSHGSLFQQAVYLTPLFERGGLAIIAVGRDEVGLTDFSLRQPAYYFAIIALLTQFRMSANGWSRYNT